MIKASTLWTLFIMLYSSFDCVLKWCLAHSVSTSTAMWWILTLSLRLRYDQTSLHLKLIWHSSRLDRLFDNADLRGDLTLGSIIHFQCLESFIVSFYFIVKHHAVARLKIARIINLSIFRESRRPLIVFFIITAEQLLLLYHWLTCDVEVL